jgi:hypothetical protein
MNGSELVPFVAISFLWSEIHGLGANVVVSRLEGTPRDDVDPDTQEFLKILAQADVIKKGGAWLKVHEQIQIAVWASLSSGDGAEHRDPASPAIPRDAEDLRAAAAQALQVQHIIGHGSKVSPHAEITRSLPSENRWSAWRTVIDLRAVIDVEDVDNAAVLVDPVNDAIGAAPGAVTASERPEQRLADPLRVSR